MAPVRTAERGFSLTELMLTIAVASTLMVVAVPVYSDVSDGTKLNGAARELERELQGARLKAVTSNRILRVRLNCPGAGYYRTVEYLNTSADVATNRCVLSAYPFPADNDLPWSLDPQEAAELRARLANGEIVLGSVLSRGFL